MESSPPPMPYAPQSVKAVILRRRICLGVAVSAVCAGGSLTISLTSIFRSDPWEGPFWPSSSLLYAQIFYAVLMSVVASPLLLIGSFFLRCRLLMWFNALCCLAACIWVGRVVAMLSYL